MVLQKERISEHILWVTIDRPEALNAIDFEVMEQLEEMVENVENDEEIRVLILSGAGDKIFVSGGDLKKFHTIKSKEKATEKAERMQRLLSRIEQLPCWTIAHINGDAYGGGIEMMLAFDFRISVPNAKFGFTQGRFYLVPGWGGLTRLVEKVGRAKALEWLGKSEVTSAKRVLAHGLIEHILEGKSPEAETVEWAKNLTKNDRNFIQILKDGAMRFSSHRQEALGAEVGPFSQLWIDKQHLDRVDAFMKKKK
ncbi:MAG: enoyl-CoA hydratase/isomerase family protein [Gracilimonas sp.]